MAAWMGCSAASCFTQQVMQVSARLAYCFLFALAMALTWIMRDFGKPLLEKIPCAFSHAAQSARCVSLGAPLHQVRHCMIGIKKDVLLMIIDREVVARQAQQ